MWIEDTKYDDVTYYSIKSLQKEAAIIRSGYKLIKEPKMHNITKCYFCQKDFLYQDTINFYSDTDNEYCYHNDCTYTVYKFEKKQLVVYDLQNIINATNDIDYTYDNIIPRELYKINLIHKYIDYNLDFSQSKLYEIYCSKYNKLESDNFKSVQKLTCNETLVDFTKFTNLTNLKLLKILENSIITPCTNLIQVTLNNINYTVDFTNCSNLEKLSCYNITQDIILKGCTALQNLELNNVNVLINITDCINLQLLRIENMNQINVPKNINSLIHLHITNIIDCLDVSSYINLKTFTNTISTCYTINNNNQVLNYNNLSKLDLFIFSDLRSNIMNDNVKDNLFDFTNNHSLYKINIYSAKYKYNIIFGENPKLEECILDFFSDSSIKLPQNIKLIKNYKNINLIS